MGGMRNCSGGTVCEVRQSTSHFPEERGDAVPVRSCGLRAKMKPVFDEVS